MSKNLTFGSSAPQSAPITKLPVEILIEIFKSYAKTYPEVRNERVVDLCLVSKHWNAVAHNTPHLWTKINLCFPFADDHLDAARKRIHASKLKKIDIFINFCNSERGFSELIDDEDEADQLAQSIWVYKILTLLRGTEERWESIDVVSRTWFPLHKLMEGFESTYLPSLKSISMERDNSYYGRSNASFRPLRLIGPMTLFGRGASLPKLRDLSLTGVHIDWDDASAVYRNLRKLELKNLAFNVAPSFEQFAEILSSSPRLEHLDVSGFCPEHHPEPPPGAPDPEVPVVYLPALKDFIFGWNDIDQGHKFLQMFQIGSSLETLVLIDTESGLSYLGDEELGDSEWALESQGIFEALYDLGSRAPQDESDIPSGPFISMREVKRLEIIWTGTKGSWLIPLMGMLTKLESICLEDVDENVLKDIVSVLVGGNEARRPLRTLDLHWGWHGVIPDFAEPSILQLENAGIRFNTV